MFCFTKSGDSNTEKMWVHRLFAKQKKDVPMGCKVAARGQGSIVSPLPPVGVRGQSLKKILIFYL